MTRRRLIALVLVGLVALAATVGVGRWERSRWAARENAEMSSVYAAATSDGLISGRLDAYRLAPYFDCLLYHPPGHPQEVSALELCFDPNGILVETIDRLHGTPRFGTVRSDPSVSKTRLPVSRLEAAFLTVSAGIDPRLVGRLSGPTLPVSNTDLGISGSPGHRHSSNGTG
jgi:hypothetical protein